MANESPDIFGYKRNANKDTVFSVENSRLTFGDVDTDKERGYLVQNWRIDYQQNVQELFEIGSSELYWVKGRPQGQGALSRVIGGKGSLKFFPDEAYDVCKGGATMKLSSTGGACAASSSNLQSIALLISGVVVTGIGFSMQVADVRLVENIGFRFAKLEDSAKKAPTGSTAGAV